MKIERNLHKAGRASNMLFGLCEIADGLVRVLSLGFLHTSLVMDCARWQAKRALHNMRKEKPNVSN